MRRLLSLLPLLGLAVLGWSPASFAKPHVVATLPSLGAIALEVCGDAADVHVLASPRQDPHYVDPRPSLVLELNRADLLIVNGLELEDSWLEPLVGQARNQRVLPGAPGYLDASSLVTRLEVPVRVDRSMGDVHPGGNPHFLFDPRRGAKIAVGIGERLALIDPANAAGYRARAKAFAESLEAFAKEEAARFAQLAPKQREVVAYHRSLTYLFDWLGLVQAATVEPRPGIPPDPGHVARVLSIMKQHEVRAIVQEEFYPTNASKTLADLTRAELVVIPGAARFSEKQRYLAHLRQITDALYAALHR